MKLIIFAALIVLAGCAKQSNPVVILASWWNVAYAKSACALNNDSIKLGSKVEPCIAEPELYVADFENQLKAAFASEAVCNGIQLVTYRGPNNSDRKYNEAADKPNWFMTVSLWEPVRMKGEWSIFYDDKRSKPLERPFFKEDFDRNPRVVAKRVCQIVKGIGGAVHN